MYLALSVRRRSPTEIINQYLPITVPAIATGDMICAAAIRFYHACNPTDSFRDDD
jgi:hypothetical protein